MQRLGFVSISILGLAVAVSLVSCGSDDSSSDATPGGTAGASQAGAAGMSGMSQGGSGNHSAGKGGMSGSPSGGSGSAGTEPGGAGQGGEPAAAGSGGTPHAGAAGAGGTDACASAADAIHPCAMVQETWQPKYDEVLKRIELDVSSLPFRVVSGSLAYYFSDGNAHGCGEAEVVVDGNFVRATFDIQDTVPTLAGISLFSLIDECGATHEFELGTGASCNALQWSSDVWACTNRVGACVDQC